MRKPRPRRTRICERILAAAGASVLMLAAWAPGGALAKSGPLPALKGVPKAPPGFALRGKASKGRAVYKQLCQSCHGSTGKGNGVAGRFLKPRPRDLTAPIMNRRTDWQLYYVVKHGGKAAGLSATMVAFGGTLKDQDIRDVVAYVRTLARRKAARAKK